MAIYRCEFKVYGRARGASAVAGAAYRTGTSQKRGGNSGAVQTNSAVAAAAYRGGQSIRDERTGETHDYRNKENVVWSGILAPDNAPDWAFDRGKLWNAVERVEKRKDAQLFRECLLTIPRELSDEQRIALVRRFVQEQFVDAGMVADIGLHNPDASDGLDQPHAHVMLTLRSIGSDGFGLKNRGWNDVQWENGTARKDGFLEKRRQLWAEYCNAALADAGFAERVDHRSLKARGIERVPSPKIGKAGHARTDAPWVRGVRQKAIAAWMRNRAIQMARTGAKAYEQEAGYHAAEVTSGGGVMRIIGHGPPPPGPFRDLWGNDVGMG